MSAGVPDVSVVVVSWNTAERLAHTLEAADVAGDGLAAELIVVDNASTDGTRTMLAEKFPGVRTVLLDDNIGFARACNAGARAATGRTLLFLNSDCELQAGTLPALLGALDAAPDVGAALPRLVNADGTLQPSVHDDFPTPFRLLAEACFLGPLRYAVYRRRVLARWLLAGTRARHARSGDVAWGGAACLLVRRQAWDAVGGFDERFFMYWEDVDLCRRLRDAGWRVGYVAEASAVHHWGASAAQRPPAALIAPWTSRLRYFTKHDPAWSGIVYAALTADLGVRRVVYGALGLLPSRRAWADARVAESRMSARAVADAAAVTGTGTSGATLLLALVVALAAARYGHDLVKYAVTSRFIDFAHYYTFAQLVAAGANPFDPAAVAAMDARLGLARSPGGADYPPLFYLLVQPWTALPFRAGALAWLLTTQLCLAGSVAAILRRVPAPSPWTVAAVLFVALSFQPLYEDAIVGQSNAVILALMTTAWAATRAQRPWLAGVAIGIAVHVKPQWGLVVPLLAVAGHWSVAGRAVAAVLAGFAVGIAVLGPAHYLAWAGEIVHSGFTNVFAWNLSARSIVQRLAEAGGVSASIVVAVTLALNAAILAWIGRALLRRAPRTDDWAWGLALTSVVLVSPKLEEHHLVVLLLPLALLLLSPAPTRVADAALVLAAALLLGSRYSFVQFAAVQSGPAAVLLAGKLLGAGALAWALARRARAT